MTFLNRRQQQKSSSYSCWKRLTAALLSIISLILFAGSGELPADQELAREYELKAVFLYNFIKYIKWENNPEKEAYYIAVLGESEIVEPLKQIALRRKIDDVSIRIRQISDIGDARFNHLLFIPLSQKDYWNQAQKKGISPDTITIGEFQGASREGVIFNFFITKGKLKFSVNVQALTRAGVTVSSHLLKLAQRR